MPIRDYAATVAQNFQPQPYNPMATLGDLVQLQNYRALMEQRQAAAEKERRDLALQDQIQGLAQQYGDDVDGFAVAVGRLDPMLGQRMLGSIQERRMKGAQAEEQQAKAQREKLGFGLQLLQGVTPENYAIRREMAVGIGGDTAAKLLPETYEPNAIQNALMAVQSVDKFLEGQQKALERFQKGETAQSVAEWLRTAQNQQQWDAVLEYAKKGGPSMVAAAQLFGPTYSPEAVAKANSVALGAQNEAMAADRAADNARQAKNDARIAANDAANLGLRRAELGLSQQRFAHQVSEDAKPKETAAAKKGPDVGAIIGQIETLSDKINTGEGGVTSTVTGWIRKQAAKANYDNDVAEYESLVSGMIPMVARAVGHTGVLTQQDVDSVRDLFPKVGDNQQLAKNKIARVKALISSTGQQVAPAAPANSNADALRKKYNY